MSLVDEAAVQPESETVVLGDPVDAAAEQLDQKWKVTGDPVDAAVPVSLWYAALFTRLTGVLSLRGL